MTDLWKELHVKALNNKGENENKYLAGFSSRIPRYTKGCKCKEHWTNWIKSNPPTYGTNGEFFEWTVRAHNEVNRKLGKPTYTVEQAKAFYSK